MRRSRRTRSKGRSDSCSTGSDRSARPWAAIRRGAEAPTGDGRIARRNRCRGTVEGERGGDGDRRLAHRYRKKLSSQRRKRQDEGGAGESERQRQADARGYSGRSRRTPQHGEAARRGRRRRSGALWRRGPTQGGQAPWDLCIVFSNPSRGLQGGQVSTALLSFFHSGPLARPSTRGDDTARRRDPKVMQSSGSAVNRARFAGGLLV